MLSKLWIKGAFSIGMCLLFSPFISLAQVSGDLVFVYSKTRKKPYLARFYHQTDSNYHFKSIPGIEYSLKTDQVKKVRVLLNTPEGYPGSSTTTMGRSYIPGKGKEIEVGITSYFAAPYFSYKNEYFWFSGGTSFLGISGIPLYGVNIGFILPQKIGKSGHLGLSISHYNLYFPRFQFPGFTAVQLGYSTGNNFRSHTFTGGFIILPLVEDDNYTNQSASMFRYSYYSMRKENRGTMLDVIFISTPIGIIPTVNYARRYWKKKWYLDAGISFLGPLSLVSPILPYIGAGYRFGNGNRRKLPDENSYWGY